MILWRNITAKNVITLSFTTVSLRMTNHNILLLVQIHTMKEKVHYLRIWDVKIIFVLDSRWIFKSSSTPNHIRGIHGISGLICKISIPSRTARRNRLELLNPIFDAIGIKMRTTSRHQHVTAAIWRMGIGRITWISSHGHLWNIYRGYILTIRHKVRVMGNMNLRIHLCHMRLLLLQHGNWGSRNSIGCMGAITLQSPQNKKCQCNTKTEEFTSSYRFKT